MRQRNNSKVCIRESVIHGKGLFAAQRIRPEALIGTFLGKKTQTDGMHVLWVCEDEGEFGIRVENELRYINHSDEPNAEAQGDELFALRNIQPGHEITMHYGDEWEQAQEEDEE